MGAKNVEHAGMRTIDIPVLHQKYYPLGYQALLFDMLQSILYSQQVLLQSENNSDHLKMKNESVIKSLEKLKKVLEEKRKNGQAKSSQKPTRLQPLLRTSRAIKQLLTVGAHCFQMTGERLASSVVRYRLVSPTLKG